MGDGEKATFLRPPVDSGCRSAVPGIKDEIRPWGRRKGHFSPSPVDYPVDYSVSIFTFTSVSISSLRSYTALVITASPLFTKTLI